MCKWGYRDTITTDLKCSNTYITLTETLCHFYELVQVIRNYYIHVAQMT